MDTQKKKISQLIDIYFSFEEKNLQSTGTNLHNSFDHLNEDIVELTRFSGINERIMWKIMNSLITIFIELFS